MHIDQIFEMLSWNNDEEIQCKGIEEAKKIKYLSVLIQPLEDHTVWENCAKVLASKSDEALAPYLIPLFKWLRDMNWPGAYIIYDRLKTIPAKDIEMPFTISLSLAEKENDSLWKQALMDLKKDSKIRVKAGTWSNT